MKNSFLFWSILLLESIRAQTVVYTTGPDGSTSAYLIVVNSTSATASSSIVSINSGTSRNGSDATITSSPSSSITQTSRLAFPTTPYTGQSLLTGSCSIPVYTVLQYEDGHFVEVPLIGCSDERPECCPSLSITQSTAASTSTGTSLAPTGVISMLSQAPLKVCPSDMVDMDPVCCPSGFTKWGQAILGNTPCASQLSTSYIVPTSVLQSITSSIGAEIGSATSASTSVSLIIIETQIIALGLPCADNDSDELGTGAKAGIGVGVGLGVVLIICLCVFMYLRIRRRKQEKSKLLHSGANPSGAGPSTSKMREVSSSEYTKPMPEVVHTPNQMQQHAQWASPRPPQEAGYSQGFMDGVRAAMSPFTSPPQSPPPNYVTQRNMVTSAPVEAPTGNMRHERHSETLPELSASETNTRSSVV